MSDINEPIPGSLKGFIRGDDQNKKPAGSDVYNNRYFGKQILTKEEVLDQISIWSASLLIDECRK